MASYKNEEKNPGSTAELVFSCLILLFFPSNLAEKVLLMLIILSNNSKLDGLRVEQAVDGAKKSAERQPGNRDRKEAGEF